nr:adenylosuccinate lyase [bacterium]
MPLSISPLDGRYRTKVAELLPIFSEFGLMRARTAVEIRWLIFLSEKKISPELSKSAQKKLEKVLKNFGEKEYAAIKKIEAKTNHDVKAVEIFLQKFVPKNHWSWIHFACTSEDINSCAYGLILKNGVNALAAPLDAVTKILKKNAKTWKSVPMLARTHGQTATPTTVGHEFAVFWVRGNRVIQSAKRVPFFGKFAGATGNFAAHAAAFPKKNWSKLSKEFVEKSLGLDWNGMTTQIESHDAAAALLNEFSQLSNIFIDLSRDIWGYISLGYFGQKKVDGEVGSSTMPHKVNPIDFENAEGNLKLARGIARTLADELPISRFQRDLTDSTLQRNFGLVFGHFLLALKSLEKGLGKLELRKDVLKKDLKNAPEVLTEAVQTVLRKNGHADAYDQLKNFSRGKKLSLDEIRKFVAGTKLPPAEKKLLGNLTPETYTGEAAKLVDEFLK